MWALPSTPTEREDIDTEPLFEERMQLVVNPAHLARRAAQVWR